MPDLEKVIKGLECCVWTDERLLTDCENCPYSNGRGCCNSLRGLHMDALTLLKEQKAVEPIEREGFYYCGKCKYAFTVHRQKYCSDCGRKVKWE